MNDDIQFKPVTTRPVRDAVAPDRDARYSVLGWGNPSAERRQPGDGVRIFAWLQALQTIESHLCAQPTVEAGGLLLGVRCIEADGRPFVAIQESLPARHGVGTPVSFTFTHDTWSALARERSQRFPDLEICGWYHSHPGWGVFLSEQDRFLHRHFFPGRQDVACVFDPQRHALGWFSWATSASTRLDPASGIYLVTPAERTCELEAWIGADRVRYESHACTQHEHEGNSLCEGP
jgi:proteasome lid subunit RPN8/RPN11